MPIPVALAAPPDEAERLRAENAALWAFVAAADADYDRGGHILRADVKAARDRLRAATGK